MSYLEDQSNLKIYNKKHIKKKKKMYGVPLVHPVCMDYVYPSRVVLM